MKLNLGCGENYIPGFIHVDVRSFDHIDYVCELDKLPFDDSIVDLIYASHVLEHFGRHKVQDVLEEWCRVLKPGGTLRLAVPDFESICMMYAEDRELINVYGLLMGGQQYEYNYHKSVFDYESLNDILFFSGFENVRRYDWRDTIHKDYDDYSQSYLPHMDKKNGTLMSLNIEAIKGSK